MSKTMDTQEKYIDIVARIDAHYETMRGMRPIRESAVKRYYDDFSVAACHNSTAIEGNTFTIDETYLLLREGVTSSSHSLKEHNEILGYGKGYWFVYESLKNGEPISEEFIKAIHKRAVFSEDHAGQYRDVDVVIGSMMTDRVDYAPPSFSAVPDAMKEYVARVNEELKNFADMKTRKTVDWNRLFHMLADHHCRFERIHPFEDGNGRAGRLLLTYEIISLGLLPVDIRYAEKARYYAGLKSYDTKTQYGTRPESKTEGLAKLLAECELRSMEWWLKMFTGYVQNADAGGNDLDGASGAGDGGAEM